MQPHTSILQEGADAPANGYPNFDVSLHNMALVRETSHRLVFAFQQADMSNFIAANDALKGIGYQYDLQGNLRRTDVRDRTGRDEIVPSGEIAALRKMAHDSVLGNGQYSEEPL